MTGITLHLIFLATSEDDYQMKFTNTGASALSNPSTTKKRRATSDDQFNEHEEKPLEERDELISPRVIFNYILQLYKIVLQLAQ